MFTLIAALSVQVISLFYVWTVALFSYAAPKVTIYPLQSFAIGYLPITAVSEPKLKGHQTCATEERGKKS